MELLRRTRAYPAVLVTLAVGTVAGVLELAGHAAPARVLVSAFAALVMVRQARHMVQTLRKGSYGVDVLAATAIAATVLVGEHWAALVVCLMLAGGEALEDYATNRAARELGALLERAPRLAHLARPDGSVVDVPVDEIRAGDRFWVKPGEVVPVDGVLLTDDTAFDEASLTGEPLPVERRRGDAVMSGSIDTTVPALVRATTTAAGSQYQAIIALVAQARTSKAPFVRLADRVALPFSVLAYTIGATAWALTGDPVRFAEVLVVATPCPLIIAAPVAFMAGTSRAARSGIICKSASILERLAHVRTVALDKTGTLTRGRPEVVEVRATDPFEPSEVLRLAAAVERYSTHPLAAAIVAAAEGSPVPAAHDVEERTAHGVTATVDGRRVVVGKRSFVSDAVGGAELAHPSPGRTGVHVAVDGRDAGVIGLADPVRGEAAATVAALRATGVRSVLVVTGDTGDTARHVAAEVGIDDVRAELLPRDKVDIVGSVADRPVMMIGDGINDAPVLAVADIGVAMGAKGSTAASESADVVVMLDDLSRTVQAVRIGRRTMRVAWQAIVIGVGLSVVLMLVAAAGALPAIVGAWLQEAVDLTCTLWALLAARPGAAERGAPTAGEGPGAAASAASAVLPARVVHDRTDGP